MTKKLFTAIAAASLLAGPALAGDETTTQQKTQERNETKARKAETERAALRHVERHVVQTSTGAGAATHAAKGSGAGEATRAAETVRSGEMRGAAPAVPGGTR
jgi:Ni/Co efflux regulator RcnB